MTAGAALKSLNGKSVIGVITNAPYKAGMATARWLSRSGCDGASDRMDVFERNRGKIVMGVDDVAINLKILGAYIQKAGFTFIGAASGAECLDLTTRIQPRLLLLDIQMPGIDGIEVCSRLRRRLEFRHVPIAFLTASNKVEDFEQGVGAGGNDFITKPVQEAKLIERVSHWVNRRVS